MKIEVISLTISSENTRRPSAGGVYLSTLLLLTTRRFLITTGWVGNGIVFVMPRNPQRAGAGRETEVKYNLNVINVCCMRALFYSFK